MKKFIEVTHNWSPDLEKIQEPNMELISVDNIEKVFRYYGGNNEWIICYVFMDKQRGRGTPTEIQFFEKFPGEVPFRVAWRALVEKLG